MRVISGLAIFFIFSSGISEAAQSGSDNPRNRSAQKLQVIPRSSKRSKTPVTMEQGLKPTSSGKNQQANTPSHSKAVTKQQAIPFKSPGLHENNPEKTGADQLVFSELLSEKLREIYQEMGPTGKKLALRLYVSGQDAELAVADAFYEMNRRQQNVNRRKNHSNLFRR